MNTPESRNIHNQSYKVFDPRILDGGLSRIPSRIKSEPVAMFRHALIYRLLPGTLIISFDTEMLRNNYLHHLQRAILDDFSDKNPPLPSLDATFERDNKFCVLVSWEWDDYRVKDPSYFKPVMLERMYWGEHSERIKKEVLKKFQTTLEHSL